MKIFIILLISITIGGYALAEDGTFAEIQASQGDVEVVVRVFHPHRGRLVVEVTPRPLESNYEIWQINVTDSNGTQYPSGKIEKFSTSEVDLRRMWYLGAELNTPLTKPGDFLPEEYFFKTEFVLGEPLRSSNLSNWKLQVIVKDFQGQRTNFSEDLDLSTVKVLAEMPEGAYEVFPPPLPEDY